MPAKKTATKSRATRKSTPAKKKTASKKTASPKTRATSSKSKSKSKSKSGEQEVTIDRRSKADRRDEMESVSTAPAEQAPLERREKVQRRRQIDPTTCERDYSDCEVEFMNAMDEYKRTSGRMFPTCSEVLEVIRGLGYTQLTPAEMATIHPEVTSEDTEETVSTVGEQDDFEDADLKVEELAF